MTDASVPLAPVPLASERFARGFNCAQSIFSAYAEQHGVSSELALRLAAPFGAGVARLGETCGALSGALLVLGLRYAEARPEGREKIYEITREFVRRFREQHGSMLCRELLGYDISTPEGLSAARARDIFAQVCPLVVEQTAIALGRYLDEHPAIQADPAIS